MQSDTRFSISVFFFFMNQFPLGPEYTTGFFSNFYKNFQRYSQVKGNHQCTSVNDTGDNWTIFWDREFFHIFCDDIGLLFTFKQWLFTSCSLRCEGKLILLKVFKYSGDILSPVLLLQVISYRWCPCYRWWIISGVAVNSDKWIAGVMELMKIRNQA